MKKITKMMMLVFLASILFLMGGCQEKTTKKDTLKIVSTIFPGYDFAKQITGTNADVTLLLRPGMESHSYDPTPQDIIQIKNADVFIYVGGESDQWVDGILDTIDTSRTRVIKMMDSVDKVEEEVVEGMQEEEEESKTDEPEYDEHVWTSPRNAIQILNTIADAVIAQDQPHQKQYEINRDAYQKQLEALDSEFKEVVKNASRTELVFGDRFPLRYFVEEYNLSYVAAFPGCSSDTEANASTIAFLINKVKQNKIPVVFYIELSNQKIANTIAEATGAKTLEFHTAHNVTKEEFNKGITYLSIMQNNVKVLKEALF